ncbi:MAG: hypothetical protein IJP74_02840, partial [Prevotella sp.]|nr:hypothetical protein [Prevotella sp.]
PMMLRTCLGGRIVAIDATLTFVSDDNIGTSWDPYVINLQNVATGIGSIDGLSDDDDAEWYTLQGFKIGHRPTVTGVYIHRGQVVTLRVKN